MGGPSVARLQQFVRALRGNGMRVAQQETMDAMRAVSALGGDAFAERETLRALLKTTLAKQPSEEVVFDRVFDLTFGFLLDGAALGPDLLASLTARGLSPGDAEALAEALRAALAGDPDAGLAAALLEGDTERATEQLRDALDRTDTQGLTSPLQVGYFAQRLLHQLGLDDVAAQLARARDVGAEPGAARELARGLIDERLLALRRMARAAMRAELEKQTARTAERENASLAERPFRPLTAVEEARMKELIRRMAERLKARVVRRERKRRRGRLALRRTLRTSMATGGVPLRPRFVRRRVERPEIVLLCDVSDSVRTASSFMLCFVYAVHDLFSRVRAFVFVDRLGEVSDLFDRTDVDDAIDRVLAGEVISVFANSDYGGALRDFAAHHLESLTARTTVVVLGDGRTNYTEPEAWVLEEIKRRVERVIWLCPEARGTWGSGDSRMPQYARHTDEVHVVRSVADLARVVDKLVL